MIVITGATGNTGSVAAEALLAKGEKVRVVGRDASRLQSFVTRGAEAVVANLEDKVSLARAFEGATAVYAMIPENMVVEDFRTYQERVADAIASAVVQAQVPYVVTLSSVGAQHAEGTGPIAGLHSLEQKLNRLRGVTNVLHVRADFFMENLLKNIPPMRTFGTLPGGLPGDLPLGWIATKDIGTYAAGRLAARDFADSSSQEITGPRDITMKEAASIIGPAIGKPNLGYMQVPFLMLEPALAQMMPRKTAALVIEMWKGAKAGLVVREEPRSEKNTMPTTLESFVSEVFAPAYLGKTASA
jgi:uncharacterized protein YbjT (DUF2867 family)